MKSYEIDFCKQLAKGVARHFGSNCEVVVHDLCAADPERSVVAIENGHVSGRRLGDGPSHAVWEALKADPDSLDWSRISPSRATCRSTRSISMQTSCRQCWLKMLSTSV